MVYLAHPVVQGALAGFITAALVDLQAWQSWDDARFQIGTATFRWVQGAVLGAATMAGFQAVA